MLGTRPFYPSKIEDAIYDLLIDFSVGSDIYEEDAVDAVTKYVGDHAVEWNLVCTEWNCNCGVAGGTCYVSWIEEGHLHAVDFEYRK